MRKLFTVLAAAISICSCCTEEAVKYNRGIGIYPGNPDEDFSPTLTTDKSYRNIALNRAVYNSSSYDYCLTGQLVTDGIVEENPPQYFVMQTSKGEDVRREREWLIDQHPYTRFYLHGNKAYIHPQFRHPDGPPADILPM